MLHVVYFIAQDDSTMMLRKHMLKFADKRPFFIAQ